MAIKFCGGCNPTFDRVAYWDRIQRAAGARISWVPLSEDHDGAVLLVSGCARGCPAPSLPSPALLLTVKSPELAPDDVVRKLAFDGEMP